ncbi:MAG TPA: DNA polymerase III subunit gamma/tau [Acidimicrobiales bacterium]|nr:DNA polymerase III subunit gamma/tau [Acidimicrobiales bacterium]
MADQPVPTSIEGVTALYRRFRPGRFAELRGQDHVVRALQGAVASGRVVHAYLFSGPRGTGKTTAARILAKALNCEHPIDGDACNECASCVAITRGTSLDVTELDAASNNGVDDVRDITVGAWHGTPGRWKVYIFDEVHQLSKAASAALLKTLEEPPPHVVFVLATTDPHKVLPTIRSRTQHLEFRLFGAETLGGLLSDIRDAAGLSADDATIEAAVRQGRGSARDALSALDQFLATGPVADTQPEFDVLFSALAESDAVAALTALATLLAQGWDPEQLTENFIAELRQAFLLQVAPNVAAAVDADRERLAQWGARLGLARTVRVLETLGRTLREMRGAPEKTVTLEVALVRLTRAELDTSIDALAERVTRLEKSAASSPEPAAPVRRPIASAPAGTDAPEPAPSPPSALRGAPTEPVAPVTPPAASTGSTDVSLADFRERFAARVVPRTARSAQLVLKNAEVRAVAAGRVTIAVASEDLRQNSEMVTPGLRSALEHEFKVGFSIDWIVDGAIAATPSASRTPARARAAAPVADDEVDGDAGDAAAIVVDSVAEHLITEMFPGAQEIS